MQSRNGQLGLGFRLRGLNTVRGFGAHFVEVEEGSQQYAAWVQAGSAGPKPASSKPVLCDKQLEALRVQGPK